MGQGVGVLKRGGGWNLLTNYVNNKMKNMKQKMKKVWSWKCDKTLVGTEESTETVIQKCPLNKVFGKNVSKMSLL